MKTTIEDLLVLPDSQLCDAVLARIHDACDAAALEPSREEERLITFTWQADGLVSNGGVKALLASNLAEHDPGLAHTARGFATLEVHARHQALVDVVAWFGDGPIPEDAEARLRIYDRIAKAQRDRVNSAFWSSGSRYYAGLARYVREHQVQIEEILRQHEELARRPLVVGATWDAGDLPARDVAAGLAERLAELPAGPAFELVARDPEVHLYVRSLCAMYDFALVRAEPPRFWVRRKESGGWLFRALRRWLT